MTDETEDSKVPAVPGGVTEPPNAGGQSDSADKSVNQAKKKVVKKKAVKKKAVEEKGGKKARSRFRSARYPLYHPYQKVRVPIVGSAPLDVDSWVEVQVAAKVLIDVGLDAE